MGLTEVSASIQFKKKTLKAVAKQLIIQGKQEIVKSFADRAAVKEVREYSGTIYYEGYCQIFEKIT